MILDFLYPDGVECVLCNRLLYKKDPFLCTECDKSLSYIKGKSCAGCGVSLPNFYDGASCGDCVKREQFHKRTLACVTYDEFSSKAIWQFKYHHKRYIGRMFGHLMADIIKATYVEDVNLIVPVPIWKGKSRRKGYNHSSILAKEIGKVCGIKVMDDFLIRSRESRPLKELTKQERERELVEIFQINSLYKELYPNNKKILLVDDIYTTGTTIKECCRTLNKSGYNDIIVVVFATGIL